MVASQEREHGYARYKLDKCRCYTCAWANSQYVEARARAIAYGTWQPFVDAAPVRQHLQNLQSCGIGLRRIAEAVGVDRKRLQAVLTGRPERGTGPQERVRPDFAAAVLGLEPSLKLMGSHTPINAVGTHRRLQALMVAGWPMERIAAALGQRNSNMAALMLRPQVIVRTALTVQGLYDQWWRSDPRAHGVDSQAYAAARKQAARLGWAPVGAWDDDTIDDPAAVPDLGEAVTRTEAIAEDATWLMESFGYDRQAAADRLGISKNGVAQALSRTARANGEAPAEKPVLVWEPPKCGEPRMYRQHLRRGESCEVCRGANAAADRRYRLTGSRAKAS
ncbi:hypothetical protein PV677_36170 [Streptomyces sp. DE06-01C]|uniref:hypothetical protein n=1 Tax=Streptomyces sp. DE06-01C TaxID=3028656 RepID=UPI0029C17309|nr:hypothetical protein [Streptomyces sp. DE06-01C]MDX5526108.1 hypothetical protein [Streptomyces sp. DE06-01C]